MDDHRKLGPLLILFLLFSLVPTIARADDWADPDAPEFWPEGAGGGQEAQQGGNFGYTPVPTVTVSDASIESSVYFDGANYIYITPYGNYTWLQPGNLLRFTNFIGDRVIEQACFVLQYQSGTSWLPLLPSEQQIYQVTDTYYGLRYNLTIKEKGQTYTVANVRIEFSIHELNKPKISVSLNKTDSWIDPFGDPDFRWIWDIVPYIDSETGEGWKYWKNDTLVDVTSFEEAVSIGNYSRVEFTDNTTQQIQSVLDVSDYGSIDFDIGKTFWNSRGFVGIFPVNQGDIDPITYTEEIESFSIGADTAWTDYDLFTNQGVPKGAIAEIVCANKNTDLEREAGVRTDGSELVRYIDIHEAEGDGVTTANMLVKCDSSTGLIECYAEESDDIDYYLLGYFEGCDFTEKFNDIGAAGAWTDKDLSGYGVPANAVCQIMLAHSSDVAVATAGVRANGSPLERKIGLDEAEDGGYTLLSMIVKADGSSIIEVYRSLLSISMYLLGWFDSTVNFTEGWTEYNPAIDNFWTTKTIAEAPAESVVAFALTHEDSGRQTTCGLSETPPSISRWIDEHEAEGGGNTGFQACVQLDSDKKCRVYCWDASEAHFYYSGFFTDVAAGDEYDRTATQSIGWSSSLDRDWTLIRSFTQGISWSSSLDRTWTLSRAFTQGLSWSSSLSKAWSLHRTLTQSLTFAWDASVLHGEYFSRTISMGLSFVWNAYESLGEYFSRTVSMGLSFAWDAVRSWIIDWGFLDIHVTTLGGDPLENARASAWFFGENITTFTEFTNITGYIPQQNLTDGNYTLLVTLENFLPYHHLFNISSNLLLEVPLQSVDEAVMINFNIELLIFASISMLFTFLALMGTPENALAGAVGGFFTWFATGIWFLLSQEPSRTGFWYFFLLLAFGCLMLAYRNFLKITFNRGKRGAWKDYE